MIEEHKEFNINNLLSFRASLTQDEMQKEMQNLEKFINDNNITIVGSKINTTYSVTQGIVPTMDIEMLIPIDKEFQETEKYKFKPELKLINALKSVHKGNPQGFNDTVIEIQKYIQDNKLMSITSLYIVNVFEVKNQEDMDKFHAELYISINPNIL